VAVTRSKAIIPVFIYQEKPFWVMAGVKQGSQNRQWETKDPQLSEEQILKVPVLYACSFNSC